MHLMRTFIEESLCFWNLSHDAQKHVQTGLAISKRVEGAALTSMHSKLIFLMRTCHF